MDAITLGDQLRELRKKKGWRTNEFARRLRKPHSMISNFESGKVKPTIDVLAEIAKELGMQYLDLERVLLAQVPDGRAADFVQEKAVQLELPFEEDAVARITCQRAGSQMVLTVAVGKSRKAAS